MKCMLCGKIEVGECVNICPKCGKKIEGPEDYETAAEE